MAYFGTFVRIRGIKPWKYWLFDLSFGGIHQMVS